VRVPESELARVSGDDLSERFRLEQVAALDGSLELGARVPLRGHEHMFA
jgi:hypothetical protein